MRIIQRGTETITVLNNQPMVSSAQDMLDLMATESYEHDATAIVIPASSLDERFFSLKTGLAGEILQKFSNYQMKLAIVGDFSNFKSKPLQDFIRECNRGNRVFFKDTEEEAIEALCGSAAR